MVGKHKGDQGGRPVYEIDYKTLDNLCGIMCTAEEISSLLEIDRDTLSAALKRDGHDGFSAYYKKKSANGKMSLRRVQYKAALDGNTTMLVWLGKQHLGQTDKQAIDIADVSEQRANELTDKELEDIASSSSK